MWVPSSPGQPRYTTGQPKWEPWLPSGQLYFSGLKMERYSNNVWCQSWATKLRTVVAQWTTGSENDLSIPVSVCRV